MQGKFAAGLEYERHVHEHAQLIFTVSGTIQVTTDVGRWLVPPQLAVWAPMNVGHSVEVVSDAESWSIYYDHQACRRWAPAGLSNRPFVLRMTPILKELLRGVFAISTDSEKAELMVRLILHELTEVPAPPTYLPLPSSVIGRRLAGIALADPMCRLSLQQLAAAAATSPRSISRLFPDETGLTFKSWRQRARIIAAIDRLSMGDTISSAATFVGFTSVSSFATSFQAVMGASVYDFGK